MERERGKFDGDGVGGGGGGWQGGESLLFTLGLRSRLLGLDQIGWEQGDCLYPVAVQGTPRLAQLQLPRQME